VGFRAQGLEVRVQGLGFEFQARARVAVNQTCWVQGLGDCVEGFTRASGASRCRENVAHSRQLRTDSGLVGILALYIW